MGLKCQLEGLLFFAAMCLLTGSAHEQKMPGLKAHASIADPAVLESSGIAVSRRFPDLFWTHNDDGPALLFAVGLDGRSIRSYELPVRNHDWEDIALDEKDNLYLLDNTSRDDDQYRTVIHVFREPDPYRDAGVGTVESFEVRYEDSGHDTETLIVRKDRVFLVTKPWDGSEPRVYVADNMKDGVAVLLGTLSYKAMITGGDITEDGRLVALSSYRALFIFEGEGDPQEILLSDPLVCPLNAGQIEGISWKGRDLILTNEQRAIFWVKESEWRAREAPREAFPTVQVPRYTPEGNNPAAWDLGTWLDGDELAGMGRIAWSEKGLHVAIQLPKGLEVSSLENGRQEDLDSWFLPGRVYVLINPRGDRQLAFGSNDRCIVVGSQSGGGLNCESRTLLPATHIQRSTISPPWIRIERQDRWLLVTLTPEGPGLDKMQPGRTMGFNLVIIGKTGKVLSWAPLTLDFSWDAPSFWGLIELVD
jgi:hypothetical protein